MQIRQTFYNAIETRFCQVLIPRHFIHTPGGYTSLNARRPPVMPREGLGAHFIPAIISMSLFKLRSFPFPPLFRSHCSN